MKRKLITALMLAGALVVPATADASVKHCDDVKHAYPYLYDVRAADMPRLTSGYAPRCLVARTLAAHVQHGGPGRSRIMGARWDAGTWRVRSRWVGAREVYTGRNGGQRVKFHAEWDRWIR